MSVKLINNSSLHRRIAAIGGELKVFNSSGWMSLRIEFSHKLENDEANFVEYVTISLKKNNTLFVTSAPYSKSFRQYNSLLFRETHQNDEKLMEEILQYLILINMQ